MKALLSVCLIVRNEETYIAEWLEFHRLVGVERFFVYDDQSTDATVDVIRRHDRGDVVLHEWGFGKQGYYCPVSCTFAKTPQISAYNHCAREHAVDAKWCAYIDADEYLYHATVDDLRGPIEQFDHAPALFVGWLVFGRNGHKTRPPGLTIEGYTRRGEVGHPLKPLRWGSHGKLIAKLDQIEHWGTLGSHNAIFKGGRFPVNENGCKIDGPWDPEPTCNPWRINHYYNRSEAEARYKVEREDRNAAVSAQPTWERMNIHDLNDVEDTDVLRFLPRLREVLGAS